MRIHRIEGENLNSLWGPFSVDIDAVLGGGSLFLIHGPTGSGKSTLMDAVSLALFGVTPRLDKRKGLENEAWDPRRVMSRGAWCCSAAVVFSKLEAAGRVTYRAKWACRRSHKRPDGKLQSVHRSIERLEADGNWEFAAPSSDKVKKYQPHFERVLEGFSSQDFNRSMLLAQGRFDAFLSAKADERAAILERLTDTSIYQEIGAKVARLHGLHRKRIGTLEAVVGVDRGLDSEAMDALVAEVQALRARADARQKDHASVTSGLAWLDGEGVINAALAEAGEAVIAIDADFALAAPALAALGENERLSAAGYVTQMEVLDGASARAARLASARLALGERMPSLLAAQTDLSRHSERLSAHSEVSEAVVARLRRLLAAAAEAQGGSLRASEAQTLARAALATETGRLEEAKAEAAEAARVHATATAVWLRAQTDRTAHGSDDRLVSEWPPIRQALDGAIVEDARRSEDGAALKAARQMWAADEGAFLDAVAVDAREGEAARSAHAGAVSDADAALRAQIGGGTPAAYIETQRGLQTVAQADAERLIAALPPLRAHEVARARAEALGVERDAAQANRRQEAVASDGAQSVAVQVGKRADEADAALGHFERVAALVVHRAGLSAGAECPLCGSEAHPWVDDPQRAEKDAVVTGSLGAMRATALAARSEASAAEALAVAATTRVQAASARFELLADQAEKASTDRDARASAAASIRQSLALGSEVDSAALEALRRSSAAEGARAGAALERLQVLKQNRQAAADALTEVEQEQARAKASFGVRRGRLQAQATRLAADSEALDAHRRRAAEVLAEIGGRIEALAVAMDGAPNLARTPLQWRAWGDGRRDAQVARHEAERAAKEAVLHAEPRREAATRAVAERAQVQERYGAQAETRTAAWEAAERETQGCVDALNLAWTGARAVTGTRDEADLLGPRLDGVALDAAMAQRTEALTIWQRANATALDAARVRERAAAKARTVAETEARALDGQVAEAKGEAAQAYAALARGVVSLGLSDLEAMRAMIVAPAQVAQWRALRTELHDKRAAARARKAERTERMTAHRAARPEDLDPDRTRDALVDIQGEAAAALNRASADAEEAHGRLMHHRAQAATHADRLVALRQAESDAQIWATLHQAIGRKEGSAFKEFAQALNLAQLLAKANIHLARLTDRYRLTPRLKEGLPTLEFDLDDLWQIGKKVAPQSLSGGERFLVSLALALGLSDFRAVRMPIETLLLDEGFGTLDENTLNQALQALTQLQADGRRVGLISHVVGLQERIEARVMVRPLGGGRSEIISGSSQM